MRRGLAALIIATFAGAAVLSDQRDPRLEELFRALASAQSGTQASMYEGEIWQRWFQTDQREAAAALERGMLAMRNGDQEAALQAFDEVVAAAPDFAEGWNRRATLHYLLGNYEASVRDIEKTLTLEPRHFGALSGLAMIREAQGRAFEALEALEKVVRIHPRLPHLAERIERLTREFGESV